MEENNVKTEKEIRQTMTIIAALGHPKAYEALQWVLGEHPSERKLPTHRPLRDAMCEGVDPANIVRVGGK